MSCLDQTSAQWFVEASHSYVEGHQKCAWCGGVHQVHKLETETATEFSCNRCDFLVRYDHQLDRYVLFSGDPRARNTSPLTMHDLEVNVSAGSEHGTE